MGAVLLELARHENALALGHGTERAHMKELVPTLQARFNEEYREYRVEFRYGEYGVGIRISELQVEAEGPRPYGHLWWFFRVLDWARQMTHQAERLTSPRT